MPTNRERRAHAEIAHASYDQGQSRARDLSEGAYREAGLTQSQATAFDQQWFVLDQVDRGDGFPVVGFPRVWRSPKTLIEGLARPAANDLRWRVTA